MFKLEPRPVPSKALTFASPLIALFITVVIGVCLFVALGKDPVAGLRMFFIEPLKSPYALSELSLKATPLILIGLGLAACFRANLWNIGAEGQFVMGAIFAGGVAMHVDDAARRMGGLAADRQAALEILVERYSVGEEIAHPLAGLAAHR